MFIAEVPISFAELLRNTTNSDVSAQIQREMQKGGYIQFKDPYDYEGKTDSPEPIIKLRTIIVKNLDITLMLSKPSTRTKTTSGKI
jgi:hypothetical protein